MGDEFAFYVFVHQTHALMYLLCVRSKTGIQ